jgi:hypothetical protein
MQRKGDVEKGIALLIRGVKITGEVLQSAVREYLNKRTVGKGLVSLNSLEKSGAKLESIEIAEHNIGDFLSVARKYDVTYSLKLDKEKSDYYVFFKADNHQNIKRAFEEYTAKTKDKKDRPCIDCEKFFNRDKKIDVEKSIPALPQPGREEGVAV